VKGLNEEENAMSAAPLVTATPRALEHLRDLLAAENDDVTGVRLGVKGGGCSGLSYLLEFGAVREGDRLIEHDGVQFFLDRKSSIYLKGVQLDYDAGIEGKGFVFGNPNATNTCGCGESFSI
jgi:iron-sulfur cluster assembly protein